MGLGPNLMEPGDQVCLLFGGHVTSIVRPTTMPSEYLFIGASYLLGFMSEEAIKLWEEGKAIITVVLSTRIICARGYYLSHLGDTKTLASCSSSAGYLYRLSYFSFESMHDGVLLHSTSSSPHCVHLLLTRHIDNHHIEHVLSQVSFFFEPSPQVQDLTCCSSRRIRPFLGLLFSASVSGGSPLRSLLQSRLAVLRRRRRASGST